MSSVLSSYRTKFIRDIIEPVSKQIIQLVEVCELADEPSVLSDLFSNAANVKSAIDALIISGEKTADNTNDKILSEQISKTLGCLKVHSDGLYKAAIDIKEQAHFVEAKKLLYTSANGILTNTLNLLIHLDDSSIRILETRMSEIMIEFNKSSSVESIQSLIDHVKIITTSLPVIIVEFKKRTPQLLDLNIGSLMDNMLSFLKENMKFHTFIMKYYILQQDPDQKSSISWLNAASLSCTQFAFLRLKKLLKESMVENILPCTANKQILHEIKNVPISYVDKSSKVVVPQKIQIEDKYKIIFDDLSEKFKTYTFSDSGDKLSSAFLKDNIAYVCHNITENNIQNFKQFYDVIKKEILSTPNLKKFSDTFVTRLTEFNLDKNMDILKIRKELSYIYTGLCHMFSNFSLSFNDLSQTCLENTKTNSKYNPDIWNKFINGILEILKFSYVTGMLSRYDLLYLEHHIILLYILASSFTKFMNPIPPNIQDLYFITGCFGELFQSLIANMNSQLRRIAFDIKDVKFAVKETKEIIRFLTKEDSIALNITNISKLESLLSTLELMIEECTDPEMKKKLIKYRDELKDLLAKFRMSPTDKAIQSALLANLKNIDQIFIEIGNAYKEERLRLDPKYREKKMKKKNAASEIPEEFQHVKHVIMQPDHDDRIGMAASALHRQVANLNVSELHMKPAEKVAFYFAELAMINKNNLPGAIDVSKKIAHHANEFLKIASTYLDLANPYLKNKLEQVLQKIPTLSTQLKMIASVKESLTKMNSKTNLAETNETLFVCSENLASAINEVAVIMESIQMINSKKGKK